MNLIILISKLTVILTLALAATLLLRRASAALRHRIWAIALAASLALPILTLTLPTWRPRALTKALARIAIPAPATPALPALPAMTVAAAAPAPWWYHPKTLALTLWFTISFLFAIRLLHGLASLAWTRARSQPLFDEAWMYAVLHHSQQLGISRPVRLLAASNPQAMPLTWGLFHPAILLPATAPSWTPERRDIVLAHELAHIARFDWAWQIAAELARALYWFHPLAWIAANRLRQESERAADDAVLNSGVRSTDYATELLELARTLHPTARAWSTALAMARNAYLEGRIIAMLNPTANRRRTSRLTALFTTCAALAVLLPLAVLNSPAQQRTGRFTGTVLDPRGAAVPNATIILTNPKTLTRDMTTSNLEGSYSFEAMPAGGYDMKVLQPGFAAYTANVALDEGRDTLQDVALVLGAVNERINVTASADPNEAPFAPNIQVRPARIRIGGNVQASNLLRQVKPPYPPAAREARIQGTVTLQALIGIDGKLTSLRVMNSQIDPDLARASVQAVSQWIYRPTLLNGEPVEVVTNIDVNFTLAPE